MGLQGSIFVPFEKVTKNDDGTVTVYGKVTSERLDADGQITDLNWFREQLPGWAEWSNIREMHKGSAVGVGLSTEDTGDAIWLESKIVDSEAARKVEAGVYKGYSYGLKSVPGNPFKLQKDAGAPNGRIVGGAVVEISVVDRPANPESSFVIVKNDALLTKEEEDLNTLEKAFASIRGVLMPATTDDSHTDEPVDVTKVVSSLVEFSKSLEVTQELTKAATCPDCGHEAGCGCVGCKGCSSDMSKKVTPDPEEETVDKTMLADVIKTMTVEERAEVGLITHEDLEALKTVHADELTAIRTELDALKSTVKPTGLNLGGAQQTGPQSTELDALEAEKAIYSSIVESASNPSTVQFAQLKVNEIEKAITAASQA